MRLLNLVVASLGARQRWKERKEIQVEERGRERGTRKKGGAGGKRARSTSARSWRGDGHPRVAVPYQTNAWPGRDRCVARLITYLRLHYCKQCVSLCVRPLSLSLSLSLSLVRSSLDAIPSRLPDPREVGFIIRHWCTRPFHRVTISARGEAFFKNYLSRFLRAIFMTVWVSLDTFFSFLL